MPFVYYRLGETNPSGLLINLLQYFQFGFEFAGIFDCNSQYAYRFIRLFSVCIQFHSANPANTHDKNQSKIHSAYSQYMNRFIPRILGIHTHYRSISHRNESHRSISHRQRCRIEVSSCHPVFKGTLRQKWSEGELLDLRSNKKK
jgi:hypothetical protein